MTQSPPPNREKRKSKFIVFKHKFRDTFMLIPENTPFLEKTIKYLFTYWENVGVITTDVFDRDYRFDVQGYIEVSRELLLSLYDSKNLKMLKKFDLSYDPSKTRR